MLFGADEATLAVRECAEHLGAFIYLLVLSFINLPLTTACMLCVLGACGCCPHAAHESVVHGCCSCAVFASLFQGLGSECNPVGAELLHRVVCVWCSWRAITP
jgi:hypothetical protein